MTVKITKPEINVREKISELDKPSGTAGQAMLAAETPQEQFNLIGAGRRNLIINGDMNIAQRVAYPNTQPAVQYNGYYTIDRFSQQLSSAGTFTMAQALDAPDEFTHSYKITTTTADSTPNVNIIRYMYEGTNMQHLAYGTPSAKPMVISFWVKSNKTGTYSFNIEQKKTSSTFDMFLHSYTIENQGVWEKKVITIPPNTSNVIYNANVNSINLHWWLGSSAGYQNDSRVEDQWVNYTGGNLTTSDQVNIGDQNNNYFALTGVQLEVGKVATPFEHRSYGEELALCQRYYQASEGTGYNNGFVLIEYNDRFRGRYIFPVTMRADPTVVTDFTNAYAYSQGNNVALGGLGWGTDNQKPTGFRVNSASNTTLQIVAYMNNWGWTADAEL
jgi:hypothetical protein